MRWKRFQIYEARDGINWIAVLNESYDLERTANHRCKELYRDPNSAIVMGVWDSINRVFVLELEDKYVKS